MHEALEQRAAWIIATAKRTDTFRVPVDLLRIIYSTLQKHQGAFAENCQATDGLHVQVVVENPLQFLMDVVNYMIASQSPALRETCNPVSIIPKLPTREYLLEVGGLRLCYATQASPPTPLLLKTFACRSIASIANYYDCVDRSTMKISADHLKEIDPLFEYTSVLGEVDGGRAGERRKPPRVLVGPPPGKPNNTKKASKTEMESRSMRMRVVQALAKRVCANHQLADGVVFAADPKEAAAGVLDIIFTSYAIKTALAALVKEIVKTIFGDKYDSKFVHLAFSMPNDFRLRRYICFVTSPDNDRITYIASFFNTGTYRPVPCVKQATASQDNQDEAGSALYIAHPIVRLQLAYLSAYVFQHKTAHVARDAAATLARVHKLVAAFAQRPVWVGVFIDGAFEKNKIALTSSEVPQTFIV